jgi:hypothetical protein
LREAAKPTAIIPKIAHICANKPARTFIITFPIVGIRGLSSRPHKGLFLCHRQKFMDGHQILNLAA